MAATRQFANKIWNAARMMLMNMEAAGIEPSCRKPEQAIELEDRWIFSRLHRTAESVNRALEQHRYQRSCRRTLAILLARFLRLVSRNQEAAFRSEFRAYERLAQSAGVFRAYLRLQHPIMPFITEELWHRFGQTHSIALAAYPQAGATDEAAEREMGLLQDMVTAARKLRPIMAWTTSWSWPACSTAATDRRTWNWA